MNENRKMTNNNANYLSYLEFLPKTGGNTYPPSEQPRSHPTKIHIKIFTIFYTLDN